MGYGPGTTNDPTPNAICDFSGFKIKLNTLVRNWDGAMVSYRFVDVRNPQDFVTGVKDNQSLPVSRPEPPDVFIDTPVSPDDL